ncbi:hypothetical protein D6D19_08730 [Aureobasidium pullulans]|uniref:Uncharacterized protein n=1 Tax=Aureobasidium pullulans TaxID=5580 RepID=A0A4S8ZRK3_AURPU|nr:hypothetical protein D6D19_08730 [Aureobasidium pullulans]
MGHQAIMDDEKTALDKFFRASYDALLILCCENYHHFGDEPPNSATRTIIRTAKSLLNDTELPEYLRLRVLVSLASVLRDETIAQEIFDKAWKIWRLDENDEGWIECAHVFKLWLFMEEEYEDKEMPFPHHGYVVPKNTLDTESQWDIVDEVDVQSDWTEDDIESTSDGRSDKSSVKSGKPTVPPKSPELYERFPVSK